MSQDVPSAIQWATQCQTSENTLNILSKLKIKQKSNLTTLLITIMKDNATLNNFLSNSFDHSVNNNFFAVILWFRSTLSILVWSFCAIVFFGWSGLGLSLTLLVLWNLSWSLEIVVLWTQNVIAICTTSLPAEKHSNSLVPLVKDESWHDSAWPFPFDWHR